jgi:acyl-[acyl-carrier-protein]-phospholipid O-acyltransferase / long-chain-fatty-acid--[acyl-carrier-protein] ligase
MGGRKGHVNAKHTTESAGGFFYVRRILFNSYFPAIRFSMAAMNPSTERGPKPEAGHSESTRGFWALVVTQFQGAFSDNTLKWLVISLIAGMHFTDEKRDQLVGIVGALFAVPFIVFSMTGGFLADRFSKRTVTIGVKLFEILVMFIALAGLATNHIYITITGVFLMGAHSAIFSPSKYGLLPELLPEKKLSWGNGVIELGTFLAIIGGTVAGGWLCKTFATGPAWSGIILIMLAVMGLFTSLGITKVPAADPVKNFRVNFVGELWTQIRLIRRDRPLWLAVVGNTYFFALGALVQLLIVIYAKDVLYIDDPARASYLQAAIAIGIGIGSFAAGHLSGGKIETGLIPFGALGLTVCAALLGRTGLAFGEAAAALAALGFFGGFFIVPISAMLQHRPARDQKGGVLAAANLVSWIGIFLASGIFYLCASVLKLSAPQIFLVVAVATLAATIYLLFLLPDALLRFFLWCLTNSIYRIRIVGRDNIPAKGGALFVCNHLSFADALLMIAATDRPVRFLMIKSIYESRWIHPFAKILGTIPVSSTQRPRELLQSLQTASEAIRNGEVVCIFAEGQITRLGQLLSFERGFERIMKNVDAPIIPIALDGVLGSPTSFERGRMVRRFPERLPHPVTVSFGAPMPPNASSIEVREAVQALIADAWQFRRARMEPMPRQFVRSARRHPRRFAMADATSGKVTFGAALVKTVFLARRLKKVWRGQDMVGLFLPPSVPGALVNHAAFLCGKVPVNLNYTLSEATIAACAKQCDIKTVITSRKFLEKIKLTPPGELVYLEDIVGGTSSTSPNNQGVVELRPPSIFEKITAFLLAKCAPYSLLKKVAGQGTEVALDDLATVIFSSGSTGEPKGVMLSHYNILSNLEQFSHILNFTHHDRVLGILPFFHSFGFTVTLCMPAAIGAGVVYHPNPLDARAVGTLVRENAVTILLATPTFLQLYMRGVPSEDFGSLQLVIVGAEKLSERLADAFEQYFGIRPLEGYGTTECAPAVSVNLMDFRAAGFHQIGGKRGKIGRVLPGMTARLADPENPWCENKIPAGEPGMLLVRGPNVMRGYLGLPEKTADVLRHGWYCTGDVATLDEDGFLQITGRLSRFSKIGGEMVPHVKIEEKLQELAGAAETMFVVAGVPDEKKGERLVVLHKLAEKDLVVCLEKFAACDLPNLWKPKADAFFRVENFSLLGTGKLDLQKVKETAAQLAG